MIRVAFWSGIAVAACLPWGLVLALRLHRGERLLAEASAGAATVASLTVEEHKEPVIPLAAKLGPLTLFDLPEQRNELEAELAPPFELLAIRPEMRTMIVSGHVYDGRSWRITLRDAARGVWDTLRPGEGSERLGIKLLGFNEGAPAATVLDLKSGERWEARTSPVPTGRLLVVIRESDGRQLQLATGAPVGETGWVLAVISESGESAIFSHAKGIRRTLIPAQTNAGSVFAP